MTDSPKNDPRKLPDYFNNFYCNLPDSLYRGLKPISSEAQRLFDDLDTAAERLEIDTAAILKKMSEGNALVGRAISLYRDAGYPEKHPEADKLNEDGELLRGNAHAEMTPLFEALLDMGYKQNVLMR